MNTSLFQLFLIALSSTVLCMYMARYTVYHSDEERRHVVFELSVAVLGVIILGFFCLSELYWQNFQFCQDTFPRWATDSFEALNNELIDLPQNLSVLFVFLCLLVYQVVLWLGTVLDDLVKLGIGFYLGEVQTAEIVTYFYNPNTIEITLVILDIVLPYMPIYAIFCFYMYLHEREKHAVFQVTLEHVSTLSPSVRRSVSGPFYYQMKKVYKI